ncbi:Bacterial regulatory protein, tetR family [compost metagenome]
MVCRQLLAVIHQIVLTSSIILPIKKIIVFLKENIDVYHHLRLIYQVICIMCYTWWRKESEQAMPPQTKFSKEEIIQAAFEIAKVEGLDQITIRKVANRLGSSIAPIYVNFTSVEELIQAVIGKISELSREILREQDTGNPFHDIGVASLRFAKEYSVLFRDLVMKRNDHMKDSDQDMATLLVEQMRGDSDLAGFTDEELRLILLKMKIFQLGLSVMIANGLLPDSFSEEQAIAMLDSAAADVIAGARLRQGF